MSDITVDQVIQTFAAAGLRTTRPRQALAEQIVAWAAEEKEFSGEELWHAVQTSAPWVGRATAFRTVQLLQDFGFLDRVTFADGTERYHVVAGDAHHHHLTCEQCHRVVAVAACIAPDVFDAVARQSGFAISGHRVEIFGRCPDCQAACK
jgi:Fur family ferric uptake transcriptional regulator